MRTTVGPLPSAVYWRRRAVVLGALLLSVLVLFLSCSGPGSDRAKVTSAGQGTMVSTTSAIPTATDGPDPDASFQDITPGGGNQGRPTPPDAVTTDPGTPSDGMGPDVTVAVPAGQCTNAEITVTPVPDRPAVTRGTSVELHLKIKNISARTCGRNVGADAQEIYLKQGARKVWSSDICGLAKGSEVKQFAPNLEMDFRVTWNGRIANKCANGQAMGAYPVAGEYQLYGRLGSKTSAPARLVIVA